MRHRKPGTAQDKRKDGRYAGRIRLAVAADRSAKSLCEFVDGAVAPGTMIVTDDWSGYAGLRKRGYDHHAIAECGDPEMTEEFLPIIHLAFANLKTWLTGTHHGVSAQHLQAYLNEFTFRFNRRFYPFNAFRSLLGIAGDAKAPTYAELYSGDWMKNSSTPPSQGHKAAGEESGLEQGPLTARPAAPGVRAPHPRLAAPGVSRSRWRGVRAGPCRGHPEHDGRAFDRLCLSRTGGGVLRALRRGPRKQRKRRVELEGESTGGRQRR